MQENAAICLSLIVVMVGRKTYGRFEWAQVDQ